MVIAKFLRITIPAPAYHREGFEDLLKGPAKREDCEPGTCSIIRLK